MKLYVSVRRRSSTALSDAGSEYGHDIEKLRKLSAYYDAVFDEEDLRKFTRDLNDRSGELYQCIRYGSQETTQGFSADIVRLMPVIDRIFFKSILLLPNGERRLLNFSSLLKLLVTSSHFDQSQNPKLVLAAIKENNPYFDEYVEYCNRLDAEYSEQLEQFRKQTGGG